MACHKLILLYCRLLSMVVVKPISAEKKLCSKIFFQNIDENAMPWVQIEGVYEVFSKNDGFPVYLNKPSGLFFYYSFDATRGIKVLTFGRTVKEFYGLVGRLSDDFDPSTWLSSGSLNKNDLFGDVLTAWMYYSPLDETFKTAQSPPFIKAICVDGDFFQCDSGKVYLNDTLTGSASEVLNNPQVDYFAKLPGVYSSIRPVFKHNRQNWYLYYHDSHWRIGGSYLEPSNDILRVQDHALRPEYVTNNWNYRIGTGWTTDPGLRIKCRGIANGENKCHGYSTCNKQGSCVYTKENETVCLCEDTAHGPYCGERGKCRDPGVPGSSVSVVHVGNRPGDIATSFCGASYKVSPAEFYVCEQNLQSGSMEWLLESEATCRVPTPPTYGPPSGVPGPPSGIPGPHPPENRAPEYQEKDPWDQSEAFMVFAITFFACHIICPVFIWLGVILTRLCLSCNGTQPGTSERLEAVQKLIQGRYILMIRIFSAFFNFAFWVWLCAICVCISTAQDNLSYHPLFYCAVGVCVFCAVFVAIEAFFSCERKALQNLVTWEYIQHLQAAPPVVTMVIERYDLKLSRQAVYRTNALTGRSEYQGTEEQWRKVGRKTFSEPFVYSSWRDESTKEEIRFDGKLIRLRIHIDITLEGEAVAAFEAQKVALIEKTQELNQFYNITREDSVANHHPYVVLCPGELSVPCWMSEQYFWFATLFQLSWAYRWLFTALTRTVEYTLKKKVLGNLAQTGFQQVNPASGTGQTSQSGLHEAPATSTYSTQVPGMPKVQDGDIINKPLIDSQTNNKNYMSI